MFTYIQANNERKRRHEAKGRKSILGPTCDDFQSAVLIAAFSSLINATQSRLSSKTIAQMAGRVSHVRTFISRNQALVT